MYSPSGIALPSIRRETVTKIENHEQENDPTHPLHAVQLTRQRLKSSKSFATTDGLQPSLASTYRVQRWSKGFRTNSKSLLDEPLRTATNFGKTAVENVKQGHSWSRKNKTKPQKMGFVASSNCDCVEIKSVTTFYNN